MPKRERKGASLLWIPRKLKKRRQRRFHSEKKEIIPLISIFIFISPISPSSPPTLPHFLRAPGKKDGALTFHSFYPFSHFRNPGEPIKRSSAFISSFPMD